MTMDIDTTDVEKWMGVSMGKSGVLDPFHINDFRRWAQAMHHPNPLFYDRDFATASRFGEIIAPQSFTVTADGWQGTLPSLQGHIPESHTLFGGDEWWFYGPRIRAGDKVDVDHVPFDFKKTETKFAGPTLFQRGDCHYTNQRGEKIATQRATSLRYLAAAGRESGTYDALAEEKELDDATLARVIDEKRIYTRSILDLGHDPRPFDSVSVGDALPVKVIGPHTVASFATEWRAFVQNVWGSMYRDVTVTDHGFTKEMSVDPELASWDPEFEDGAYYGASRGHLNPRFARHIGMPRAYGYGAAMGAWGIDYLASWAGEWGWVSHIVTQYRSIVLAGDVTYVKGTITQKSDCATDPAMGQVHIDFVASNQAGDVITKGSAEVLLPRG